MDLKEASDIIRNFMRFHHPYKMNEISREDKMHNLEKDRLMEAIRLLEDKAAKWDDTQTQIELEFGKAVLLAHKKGVDVWIVNELDRSQIYCKEEGCSKFAIPLIDWYREQKESDKL